MWGLATGGIRQFKEGFGGEEIEYVGVRDLPLRAPIDAALRVAIPAYGVVQRARLRVAGRDAVGRRCRRSFPASRTCFSPAAPWGSAPH